MDIRKKEIRRILSGFSVYDGEKIKASSNLFNTDIQGTFTGSFTSRFFGLTAVKRQYKFSVTQKEAEKLCRKAFADMGRRVELDSAPDALALVFFPHLHNPFVMTADIEGRQLLLQYYTARTILSPLFARLYLSKWEKLVAADGFQRVELVTIKPQLVTPEPAEKKDEKSPADDVGKNNGKDTEKRRKEK